VTCSDEACCAGVAQDAFVGPAGVAAMGRGHVLGYRGVVVAHTTQQMASEPLTSVKQLDHALGDARFDLLASTE
jgi:hypothetical protein